MRLLTLAALVGSAHALDPSSLGEYSRNGISFLADLSLQEPGQGSPSGKRRTLIPITFSMLLRNRLTSNQANHEPHGQRNLPSLLNMRNTVSSSLSTIWIRRMR
jgi:hypothetical protein